MTFWNSFKDLVGRMGGDGAEVGDFRADELQLAAAALLVHAAVIDGNTADDELKKLKDLLQERFALSESDADRLIEEGKSRERDAVDLYRFTSVLCRELDQDGRKRIVEMLWEIVMADGELHEFEDNLVWRVAELLGVSARDRITLKKAVAARVASGAEA
jgi:uncharacterized tellurite resistance protein B-like protein